ncbi:hypothetical protein RI367_007482 [Sorochytrium milnesiophthora]
MIAKTLLLGLALVGYATQQNSNAAAQCQQDFDTYGNSTCASGLELAMQNSSANAKAASAPGANATQLAISDIAAITNALTQYCSAECIAGFGAMLAKVNGTCSGVSGWADTVSKAQESHNFWCATDKDSGHICAVDKLQALGTMIQQNATLAPALASNQSAASPTDPNGSWLVSDALLQQPKEFACTPCRQFTMQQNILLIKRQLARSNASAPNDMQQLQPLINQFNAKCGNDWLTMDDARFALDSQTVPTTGGVSIGQPATSASGGASNATTTAPAAAGGSKSSPSSSSSSSTVHVGATSLAALAITLAAMLLAL